MPDRDQTAEHQILSNTESILERAAQIDPAAWKSPLPDRMQARRNRSYKQAAEEFKSNARRT